MATPDWEFYVSNNVGGIYNKDDMKTKFDEFGSYNNYGNVCVFLDATNDLLGIVRSTMQNIQAHDSLRPECTRLITTLLDIIVHDIVYERDATPIRRKLADNGVTVDNAKNNCSNNNDLVVAIVKWIKEYEKINSGTIASVSMRSVRYSRRIARNASKNQIGVVVLFIITLIAIIPTIASLSALLDHKSLQETGIASFSGQLGELFHINVDDATQATVQLQAQDAVLSYASILNPGAGSTKFGLHGSQLEVIGDHKAEIARMKDANYRTGLAAGLHRPGDHHSLLVARGAIEHGFYKIHQHKQNYYIMSLEHYAKGMIGHVVDMYHEQLRVDVSYKIAKYIGGKMDLQESQSCDIHDSMLTSLAEFTAARTDKFSTMGSVVLSYADAAFERVDIYNNIDIPIHKVMHGINTCNLPLYEQGLSLLFMQYSSYIDRNIETIKNVLISIPEGRYITDTIIKEHYGPKQTNMGAISTFLNTKVAPYFSYLFAYNVFGAESEVARYEKFKLSFYNYPVSTIVASLTTGAGTLGTGAFFGANMVGMGGLMAAGTTAVRLGAAFL